MHETSNAFAADSHLTHQSGSLPAHVPGHDFAHSCKVVPAAEAAAAAAAVEMAAAVIAAATATDATPELLDVTDADRGTDMVEPSYAAAVTHVEYPRAVQMLGVALPAMVMLAAALPLLLCLASIWRKATAKAAADVAVDAGSPSQNLCMDSSAQHPEVIPAESIG